MAAWARLRLRGFFRADGAGTLRDVDSMALDNGCYMLKTTLDNVTELEQGIWSFPLAASEAQLFGQPTQRLGSSRTVLLVSKAEYRPETRTLQFPLSDVTVLDVGSATDAIAIAREMPQRPLPVSSSSEEANGPRPGDRDFLGELAALPSEPRQAGAKLLQGIRAFSPGDLKRGLKRNYYNGPDNFFAIVVQPQAQDLLVSVRGEVQHFGDTPLELKPHRAGYTRFKVTKLADVEPALDIIRSARRRIRSARPRPVHRRFTVDDL